MSDDSGTNKLQQNGSEQKLQSSEDRFSKDEIDSIADLINENAEPNMMTDPDDTGRFQR